MPLRVKVIDGLFFLKGMVSFYTFECIFILRALLLVTVLSFFSNLYFSIFCVFRLTVLVVLLFILCLVFTRNFLAGLGLQADI